MGLGRVRWERGRGRFQQHSPQHTHWLPPPLQHHPARELVVHAATVFGNLQSYMQQALDQAEATRSLWHSLSGQLWVSGDLVGGWGRGRGLLCDLVCLL